MPSWIQTVNWKTTGYAVGYLLCQVLSNVFPSLADICSVIDKLIIAAGFVSAADSTRVASIVRAVDLIAWKNKIDPATLIPAEPEVKP